MWWYVDDKNTFLILLSYMWSKRCNSKNDAILSIYYEFFIVKYRNKYTKTLFSSLFLGFALEKEIGLF